MQTYWWPFIETLVFIAGLQSQLNSSTHEPNRTSVLWSFTHQISRFSSLCNFTAS